ncbi:ABC transporter transmembrane domain-containing protein [Lachnotalea glycerini]|nr:ABC transporter transmembrane domain-containing protein [Lachnotalea glycerini]
MMYFSFILQFICFVIWIVLYFTKGEVLFLIVAAIMPLNALSTYFYYKYKKKNKELTDKNSDEDQER